MTKQLLIIYDEKLKDCAILLYNLLSQHPNIKSSIYTEKEISQSPEKGIKKLVSREKCLYIGKDCSSMLIFDDCYNNLGINIGYIGAKAWIRCFKYEWNVDRLNEFERILKSYFDKNNLKKEQEKYEKYARVSINIDFQQGYEPWPGNIINRFWDKNIMSSGIGRFFDYSIGLCNQLLFFGGFGRLYNRVYDAEPSIRKYQYYIGVLKFYDDYLNDFLGLSDSNKESYDEGTITENEKKLDTKSISDGIDFFLSNISTYEGYLKNEKQGGQYLKSLADKIIQFQKEVNAYQNNNNPNANGYIAEVWHQFTLEIDAISKRTGDTASIPLPTFASTDVQGSWGEGYQLKYCKNVWKNAKEQSTTYKERFNKYLSDLKSAGKEPISIEEYLKSNGIDPSIDINLPIYEAQARLCPSDQCPAIKIALQEKISKELNNLSNPDRAIEAKKYQDVLDKLTDHIESPNGAKSMPLTHAESKILQSLAKEGKFDPAKYDITLAKKADFIYLTHSTINAGLNGALYAAMFKVMPYLLESLTTLIKEGKITREQVEELCKTGVSGGAQGFIQGFSVALLKNCCELGYFGNELQSAALQQSIQFNNALIIIVTTTVETIKDTIRMTNGEIDKYVYAQRLEKRAFIASFSYFGGVAMQGIMKFAPVIGYLIGSFIGSVLGGFVFEAKERVFMSICINTGFTFFGLVEQDYELPPEVKDYLGIESMNIEQMTPDEMQFDEFIPEQMTFETMNFETLDIKWAKRGVVGIRKIGYIAVDA